MKKNNTPTFKERFRYWFDNRMSRGSLGLIRILLIATLLVIAVITVVILVCGFTEDLDAGGVFWDTLSTVINAWMPSYEDGGLGYVIMMALAAIAGLLVTSVLIGIFSTAIEDKINNLKNGNSAIIEKDHIVVLGYCEGEYALIEQLVIASEDDRRCIVVAGEAERSEMEDSIRSNVEIPKNVRLVCRSIDIYDPAALEKCCIDRAQAVIINPMNDIDTVKALLAVSSILGPENHDVYICAVVSRSRYLLPDAYKKKHCITQLLANRILSKIIAHSCTQPGLSSALMEFLDYDGCNLYEKDAGEFAGLTFKDTVQRLSGGVPIGLFTKDGCRLNPEPGYTVEAGDKLLVFCEDPDALTLENACDVQPHPKAAGAQGHSADTILILGVNEEISTVLQELPEDTRLVRIAGADEEAQKEIRECIVDMQKAGHSGLTVEFVRDTVPKHLDSLEAIINDAAHIVLLNDHEKDADEADTENIIRILNLRTIREEKGLRFNITAELRRELSQKLADSGDSTDFVVASNMISLFLSQLADRPNLEPVLAELLSNRGNEIYLKTALQLQLPEELTVREARMLALENGYIMIGYMDAEGGASEPVFNPPLDRALRPGSDDLFIVIGEN